MDAINELIKSDHPWLVGHKIGFLAYGLTAYSPKRFEYRETFDLFIKALSTALYEYINQTKIRNALKDLLKEVEILGSKYLYLNKSITNSQLQRKFMLSSTLIEEAILTGLLHEEIVLTSREKHTLILTLDHDYSENLSLYALMQLPPSVLTHLKFMLDNVPVTEIDPFILNLKEEINTALTNQKSQFENYINKKSGAVEKKETSPLGKAQVMAYHLMASTASAYQTFRLAETLWGRIKNKFWESLSNNGNISRLDEELNILRNPVVDTQQKLNSVNNISTMKWVIIDQLYPI